MAKPAWYALLSPAQRAAAEYIGAPSVVLAGPGTGKTFTIQGKVISLTLDHERAPGEILGLAFTRMAARQLQRDIHSAFGDDCPARPYVGTIHSFALRQLMANAARFETLPQPVVVAGDYVEEEIIIPDLKRLLGYRFEKEVRDQLLFMGNAWSQGRDLDDELVVNGPDPGFVARWREHRRVYGYTLRAEMVYQVTLALRNYQDFVIYGPKQHVIVDEYQDLNDCDQELIHHMAMRGSELFVVGDDDQSIYGFRYANPDGIRRFAAAYNPSESFTLEECWRCDKAIFRLSQFVIAQEPDRIPKQTFVRDEKAEGIVALSQFLDQAQEAAAIAERIQATLQRAPGSVILVLFRGDYQGMYSRPIVAALLERGLAVAEAPVDPLETGEGQFFVALLQLLFDSSSALAWRIAMQVDRNRLPIAAIEEVYGIAVERDLTFSSALGVVRDQPEITERGDRISRWYANLLSDLARHYEQNTTLRERLEWALDRCSLSASGRQALTAIVEEVIETENPGNLEDLVGSIQRRTIEEPGAGLDPGIHLMTMHKAKGLTADVVFIPGIEQQIIPGRYPLGEQRRLLYVAITRAKHELYFSHVRRRVGRQAGGGRPIYPQLTDLIRDYQHFQRPWPADE